jgi:hypothetical protein
MKYSYWRKERVEHRKKKKTGDRTSRTERQMEGEEEVGTWSWKGCVTGKWDTEKGRGGLHSQSMKNKLRLLIPFSNCSHAFVTSSCMQ